MKKNYKNIYLLLAAIVILCSLASCQGKSSTGQNSSESGSSGLNSVGQEPTGQSSVERLSAERNENKVKSNVYLSGENISGMYETELMELLGTRAAEINMEPVNAGLNEKTWEIIVKESAGKKLNINKTMSTIMAANEGARVEYVFDKVEPAITADMLKKQIKLLSSFTTPLLNRSKSRVNNIEIASKKIDYHIIQPGEEFSFNTTVGRRSEIKGYEDAPIIVKTPSGPKKVEAPGGGVCQLSTTIYNAVRKCGIKVTERHMHSKNVRYVPRGDDAAVSFGTVDFKFINNRKYPVMLRVKLGNKTLNIKVLENLHINK